MKAILGLVTLFISLNSFALLKCEEFENIETESVSAPDILTKENWKTIDVIANFDYNQCKDAVRQSLFRYNGELYWHFYTNEDSCDGGNTYGVVYTYDLKTPIAHIYDTDIYCEEDWREEEKASSHTCDLAAEKLAEEKMLAFGLDFKALSSSLTLRKPYIYSYIDIEGIISNKENKEATVRVLTNLNACEYASVRILNIEI